MAKTCVSVVRLRSLSFAFSESMHASSSTMPDRGAATATDPVSIRKRWRALQGLRAVEAWDARHQQTHAVLVRLPPSTVVNHSTRCHSWHSPERAE